MSYLPFTNSLLCKLQFCTWNDERAGCKSSHPLQSLLATLGVTFLAEDFGIEEFDRRRSLRSAVLQLHKRFEPIFRGGDRIRGVKRVRRWAIEDLSHRLDDIRLRLDRGQREGLGQRERICSAMASVSFTGRRYRDLRGAS